MNLKSELDSWNLEDKKKRQLKLEREWVRYPYLIEKLGLDNLLYLCDKTVLDIGSGPMGGILQFIDCYDKISIDPLNKEYLENFPEFFNPNIVYFSKGAENISLPVDSVDLVTCINALDHVDNPQTVLEEVVKVLAPGGYLSLSFCINLAKVHPHGSHQINIDSEWLHRLIDDDFETIFEKIDKYGWVKDPDTNKVGQPALYGLYRLTTKG